MTTLADAAVEITADTEGFESELQDGINAASSTAARASTGLGRSIGQSIASGTQRTLSGLGRTISRPLRALGGTFSTLGRTVGRALDQTPGLRNLSAGLRGVGTEATGLRGAMNTVGLAANTAIGAARDNSSLLVKGFRQVGVSASQANSPFYRLGGTIQGLGARASKAFASVRERVGGLVGRLGDAERGTGLLNTAMGRLGAAAGAVAAAAGIATLGGEIFSVASTAQSTRASLTALYKAAGGGAAEVNQIMSEMATRFRGLDMSVMNEGATTLAYMGLQGSEAVDVLERLDAATTAAGTGATGMSRALDAMTKGVNAGKFMMGELSQISNAGIPIYDALSDVLGVSIPEAQKMASAGAVDLADVLEALSGEAGTWFPALMDGAEGVSQTLAGSWSTIRNSFVNGVAYELLPLLDNLAPLLARVASGVQGAFDRLPDAIGAVTDRVVDSGAWDTFLGLLTGVRNVVVSLRPLFSGFTAGFSAAGGVVLDLLGYLRPLVSQLGEASRWLSDNAAVMRVVGTAVGGLTAGIVAYRTAALLGVVASKLLAGGLRGIGVAIRGIPLLGWVLAVIGALIALYQTSDRFREIVNNAFSAVAGAVQRSWAVVKPLWDRFVGGLSGLWSAVSGWEGWRLAWEGITGAVGDAGSTISGVWGRLRSGWSRLVGALSDMGALEAVWGRFVQTFQRVRDIVGPALQTIANGWSLLFRVLSGDASLSDVGGWIREAFGTVTGIVGNLIGYILEDLRSLGGRAAGVLRAAGPAIARGLRALPGLMLRAGKRAGAAFLDQLRALPGRAVEAFQRVGGAILGYLRSLPGRVRDSLSGVSWLAPVVEGAEDARDAIQGVVGRITGTLSDLWSATGGRFEWGAAWSAVSGAVQEAWGVISPIFERIGEAWGLLTGLVTGDTGLSDVGEYLKDAFGDLRGIGQNVAGQIVEGLRSLPGRMLGVLRSTRDTVVEWFRGLPGQAREAISGEGGFTDWVEGLPGRIRPALEEFGRNVVGWFRGLPGRIRENMTGEGGVLDWLKELPGRVRPVLERFAGTVLERIRAIPGTIRDNVDPGAIVEWLRETPGKILDFMRDYGPQILKGFGIALLVVAAGIPALFLGLLAVILTVLGTIAVELAKWAWSAFTGMMRRAGEAVMSGISNITQWFSELPGRVMTAVSNFGSQLAGWGRRAMGSLQTALSNRMTALREWWSGAWSGAFSSARGLWDEFVGWASGAAGRLRDRVMTPVNALKDRMISAFESAQSGIGEAWSKVQSAVGKPINWVIDWAYTRGLKRVWDGVVGKFGGSKLPDAPAQLQFNTGGVFPGYTPGRDPYRVPVAAFSGGESVMRPEITKAWGAKTTHGLNKLARAGGVQAVRKALGMLAGGQNPFTGRPASTPSFSGGAGAPVQAFSQGGIMGTAGRAWSWLTSKTEDFAEGMADFLDDPKGIFKRLVNGLVDWDGIPGAGLAVGKTLVRVPRKILDELADAVRDMLSFGDGTDWTTMGGSVGGRLGAALSFARAQAGKPYIWGGVGPRGYDCSGFTSAITNVIMGRNPYSRRHTTHPFVGSGYDGFRRNLPSPWMIGVTHGGVGHMSGTLMGTNVESRGSAGAVIGARARGYNNPLYSWRGGFVSARGSGPGGPLGGEGITYDSGGLLPRGLVLTYNGTRSPETVRTAAQEKNVERLVRLVSAQYRPGGVSSGWGGGPSARDDALERLLREARPGTTVHAPVTVTSSAADPETVAYKTAARITRLAGL